MGYLQIFKYAFWFVECSATFQRDMDYAFKELIRNIIEIYQEDLTTFSKQIMSHVSHLKQVFERCRKYGIYLNPTKSILGIEKGKLLGQIISKYGVKVEPERIEAIKKIHLPKNVKSLLSFDDHINL